MLRKILFPVLLIVVLTVGITGVAYAAPPNGVEHLRGRWDGTLYGLFGEDRLFTLLLDESQPDPNDSQAALYNGCMAVGAHGGYAPVSARVVSLGNEQYDLTLFGTAGGSVIKLTGLIETHGASVRDDSAGGVWQTIAEEGDWSAVHHDRRNPKCPAVELGGDLWFFGDTYAAVGGDDQGNSYAETILESYTNIVSTGMLVETPNGDTIFVPPFTDIFSPQVNFIDSFRYLTSFEGLPLTNGLYTFTLLDVFGQPIPGATSADLWMDCFQDPPRNVSASLTVDGIYVTWDSVAPAPGFDPGAIPPSGFYQIGLYPLNGSGDYGAGQIFVTEHLIPYDGFSGFGNGSPDGFDFGNGLLELADGTYVFDVASFADAPAGNGGYGLECQIRSWDEQIRLEKSGDTITLLP